MRACVRGWVNCLASVGYVGVRRPSSSPLYSFIALGRGRNVSLPGSDSPEEPQVA